MSSLRHFEDFSVGEVLKSGPYHVTRDEIVAFATEFDPQSFHVDAQAAKDTLLGGLCASGWHSCSMFMRMMCDGFLLDCASQGSPGIENIRWVIPVRPGDILVGHSTIVTKTRSRSRPSIGFMLLKNEVFNQHGEIVMTMENKSIMSVRDAAGEATP